MHIFIQACILGLLTGGVYALMASGLTLVFGVMRVINVAQGALIILGAYLSYTLFTDLGHRPVRRAVLIIPRRCSCSASRSSRLHAAAARRGARGALAPRHLGARARDRGRRSASSTRRPIARRSGYADRSLDVLGYHVSVARVLRLRRLGRSMLGLLFAAAARTRSSGGRCARPCRTRARRGCSASTRAASGARRSASASRPRPQPGPSTGSCTRSTRAATTT